MRTHGKLKTFRCPIDKDWVDIHSWRIGARDYYPLLYRFSESERFAVALKTLFGEAR